MGISYTHSSGSAQWAQTVTAGSSFSIFFSVSAASDGSVYAVGYIDDTVAYDLGNGVTAAGTYSGNNIVLVKYDSSGVTQWAKTMTSGSGNSVFNGVSVASNGSVYAAGYIEGTGVYDLGGVTATGTYGGSNMLLVGYY
jgi:outer membrane protein assembly factor BamB